jgi:hypothetical protein
MQAPVFKRTTSTQLVGLALVIGLAASLALNVTMLTRTDNHVAPAASPHAHSALLREQRRYYAAKEARQARVEATADAFASQSRTLSPAWQLYVTLKSDQLNGIAQIARITSWQRYIDLKSDQMDGIASAH